MLTDLTSMPDVNAAVIRLMSRHNWTVEKALRHLLVVGAKTQATLEDNLQSAYDAYLTADPDNDGTKAQDLVDAIFVHR